MSTGVEAGYRYSRLVTASGDRDIYATAPDASKTNFTMNLGTNVQGVTKVSFHNIQFRNNAYNVNDTGNAKNNTFAVIINGDNFEFKVDPGWYDTKTLLTEVQAAIQDAMDTEGDDQKITMSYNAISCKVGILYEAGTGSSTMSLYNVDGESGIWSLLGYDFGTDLTSQITVTDGVELAATNFPSLGGLSTVYLRSSALAPGNMFDVGGLQKNYCLAIPITAYYGQLNVWDCKVDKLCEITYPSQRNLQLIDFALVDKDGQLVDLHGANLVVNLRLWFDKF